MSQRRSRALRKNRTTEELPLLSAAPSGSRRQPFFRLPCCPHCGKTVAYGQLLLRAPVFSVYCSRCGRTVRLSVSWRTAVLWGAMLILTVLLVRLLMPAATDALPLFFFSVFGVAGAFFLHPLTLSERGKPEEAEKRPEKYRK